MLNYKIDSPFFENISLISNQEITNRICTIHLNNNKEIKIPLFIAISSSSFVSKQLLSDISTNDLYFNDPLLDRINDDVLNKIIKILNHEEVQFENEDEIIQFAIFGKIIGNSEFVKPFISISKGHESNINEENVISIIKQKIIFNLPIDQLKSEISFISSHFSQFIDKLIELSKESEYQEIIECIIKDENLQLQSEDELLTFTINLCQESNKNYELFFEYVWLEYCSIECITKFIDYINNNYCNDNHIKSIMKCINRRLLQEQIPIEKTNKKRYIIKYINYEYNGNNPLNGILRQEYLKNNVELRTSGTNHGDVYYLLKNDPKLWFATTDSANSWIEGNLKDKKPFKILKYEIKGNYNGYPGHHLQTWTLEGKRVQDGKWIELDNHQNELFRKLTLKTFEPKYIDKIDTFRLTQTGPNDYNCNVLIINAFDIYGQLYDE